MLYVLCLMLYGEHKNQNGQVFFSLASRRNIGFEDPAGMAMDLLASERPRLAWAVERAIHISSVIGLTAQKSGTVFGRKSPESTRLECRACNTVQCHPSSFP